MTKQRLECAQIFLLVWILSTFAINKHDLFKNGLQAKMVYTMSLHSSFVLDRVPFGSPPPRGDVIEWNQNILPFKQPGIAVVGSIPFVIHKSISSTDLTTTLAVTSTFTTGLANALISALIFLLLSKLGFSQKSSVFSAILSGTGTTLSAYSGIIHHDPVATLIVFFSFYLLLFSNPKSAILRFLAIGLMLSLSMFISLLPVAVISVLFVWGFIKSQTNFKRLSLLTGGLVGLLPTLIYQNHFFSSPIRTASHAYALKNHTKIIAGAEIMLSRFNAYFSPMGSASVLIFMPLCVVGALGLGHLSLKKDSSHRYLALVLFSIVVAHGIFLILVGGGNTISPGGFGDCQFGPRYWITAVPFMCLGIGLLLDRFSNIPWPTLLIATWSIFVNQAGLHLGTMYCGNGTLSAYFHDYLALYQEKEFGVILLPNLLILQLLLLALTILIQKKLFLPKSPRT